MSQMVTSSVLAGASSATEGLKDIRGYVEFDFNGRSEPVHVFSDKREWLNLFESMISFYAEISRRYGEEALTNPAERIPALLDLAKRVKGEDFKIGLGKNTDVGKNMIISPKHEVIIYDKLPKGFERTTRWEDAERYLTGEKRYSIMGNMVNAINFRKVYGLEHRIK